MRFLLLLLLFATSLRADVTSDLNALAAKYYKPNEPGGVVLVRKDGKTLLRKAYGLADLELSVPMTPDNVLRTASITKQFTAVAILQLVQQGKISLDDDFTSLLPGYPPPAKKVTVEHLLTHTSGIPTYMTMAQFREGMRQDTTPEAVIEWFKDRPLEFEPGTRYAYNNSAYTLLGAIIEKHSGMKYAEYVKKHLFEPAGMTSTQYEPVDAIVPRRARGYSRDGERWINAPYLSMTIPYSAGGIVSTVDDLARWVETLRSGKLVDPKLLARAQTAFRTPAGTSLRYGYGWRVGEFEAKKIVAHSGGINGFQSELLTMPDQNLTVVVLHNFNGEPAPEWIALQLATAATGKLYDPKPIAMTAEQLDRYTGVYRLDAQRAHRLTREGDRLVLRLARGPRLVLRPLSETLFFADGFPIQVRFTLEKGIPVEATTLIFGSDEVARRSDDPTVAPPSQ